MMQPLRIYDYLTTTRARLFEWARPYAHDVHRVFQIGLGALDRTFAHMLGGEWYYIARLKQEVVPPYDEWSIRAEAPPTLPQLESLWAEQAERTRAALRAVDDWDRSFEYEVTDDDGVLQVVTTSAADLFTQLALHEIHHRAKAMHMLRRLGAVIDDIDFNTVMFPRRPATP